jgi:hypothetical protein
MNPNDMQSALEILGKVRDSLLENLVEELLKQKDEDPSSFGLQEIEDRFAIRLANVNTLIATMQDQIEHHDMGNGRIVVDIEETNRHRLEERLNEILEFIAPDEFVNLSIVPTGTGKFLIAVAHSQ